MRSVLVLMAVFFFVASLFHYQQLYRDIQQSKSTALDKLERLEQQLTPEQRGNVDYVRWKTMVALEVDITQKRYQQINATLLLRTWTRYTGFLVGMVLALVGAFFILGRLKEDQSEVSGEGGGFKLALASNSPGIILATLGTMLMSITLAVKFDFEIRNKPVYVLPYGFRAECEYRLENLSEPNGGSNLHPDSSVNDKFPRPPKELTK